MINKIFEIIYKTLPKQSKPYNFDFDYLNKTDSLIIFVRLRNNYEPQTDLEYNLLEIAREQIKEITITDIEIINKFILFLKRNNNGWYKIYNTNQPISTLSVLFSSNGICLKSIGIAQNFISTSFDEGRIYKSIPHEEIRNLIKVIGLDRNVFSFS